ncbi:unnamed protein product [Schistosoma curassoni]|uniref:UVR domain-containing protein n=1 Tax=Schistosoma curassoni TaxID=6186 RepID=A0A183KUA8_9TREM|nr:unnamed protein product [Schistosoma curassoni]
MYQDPEVANIIRRLEKQKRLAVKAERFDQAQGIRDAITQLHQVGERLGRLALEKQQAVEEENYEQAKLKKNQITEMRNNLYRDIDLMKLLSSNTSTEQREQLYGRSDNQFPDTNNDRNKIGILSVPAAFPLLISLMAILNFAIVDGVTAIGRSAGATSMFGGFNGVGLFEGSSKYSTHLFLCL